MDILNYIEERILELCGERPSKEVVARMEELLELKKKIVGVE